MADHVDKGSINNIFPFKNTLCTKEEECQKYNFIDDKVHVSETSVVCKAKLQDQISHGKIKQEVSTALDISEFSSSKVQNDKVKIRRAISADDIKIVFDNGMLYCEDCCAYYQDYCIECEMLVHILNRNLSNSSDNGAREDIPNEILEIQDCFGQFGIYAIRIIPGGVTFGPFTGLSKTESSWEIKEGKLIVDTDKLKYLNWMQYINPARNSFEQNLHVFQYDDNLYYQSTRTIQAGEELLVYFGEEYEDSLNKNATVAFLATTKPIKDVFACTFCCLGFSLISYLAKHKTICPGDPSAEFSIQELTQCRFCKIHLDAKEYHEHHLTYCCERSLRKSIPPSPSDQKVDLSGRKRARFLTYKCDQCKYITKYKADLENHNNNQHYQVKTYKCGICNRRFYRKESIRLHVENTHIFARGKKDQEHSRSDHMNAYLKVENSSSQVKVKRLKCSLCAFRTKFKLCLQRHMTREHLKEFNYKCDKCAFGTNDKNTIKSHIKTKHLKEFDYKCDKCEFGTNQKQYLEIHIKTKHLKEFDYQCYSCEFRTNRKKYLERHIKTKHLKEFDYKCDSCEYSTNRKYHLDRHKKTNHLKEFDLKCHSCDFRTNHKHSLEKHIKTNHLKEFDLTCDSCEFTTNHKYYLETHMKTKHLKKFDYKCDSCEYSTNRKYHLDRHKKTSHLKEFDLKCDSCEFTTNHKYYLETHMKTKHLKKFDFKCESCEYKTNRKYHFERHMKSKHL